MRRPAAILVAVVVFAGAASASGPGYRRHAVTGQGVSLLLPTSWKSLTAKQAKELLAPGDFERENPQFAAFVALMRRSDSPLKLIAFDPIPLDGFATNANVVALPLAGPVPLSAYKEELIREAKSIGGAHLAAAIVHLPGGAAVRLTYRLPIKSKGRVFSTATTQYAFPRANRSVVVTYTTIPKAASTYAPIFATSARSIRFGA
jgi:hypothetical protein